MPVVFTRDEVKRFLAQLEGTTWLLASLTYVAGFRLMECLRLRVKEVDFAYAQITVRDGKGAKDRMVPLPEKCRAELEAHIHKTIALHQEDLSQGFGEVFLLGHADVSRP